MSEFTCILHLASLNCNILDNHTSVARARKLTLTENFNQVLPLTSHWGSFVFRILSGISLAFSWLVVLGPLQSVLVPPFFLFFPTLIYLKCIHTLFCQTPLSCEFDAFLSLKLFMLSENATKWCSVHTASQHMVCDTDMSLGYCALAKFLSFKITVLLFVINKHLHNYIKMMWIVFLLIPFHPASQSKCFRDLFIRWIHEYLPWVLIFQGLGVYYIL